MSSHQTDLFDHLSLPCMILDRDLCFTYANLAYRRATKTVGDDLIGQYIFDVFPDSEERVAAVKEKFDATLNGQITQLDAQPFQLEQEDGTIRDAVWQATQNPVRNADGEVTHMIQWAEDITTRHELEKRNQAITIEMNHRIKNMMAVIVAIARITGRNARDLPDFMAGFTERINAMSRANDRLAHDNWTGLSVREALEVELEPYAERTGMKYNLSGPAIKLSTSGTKDFAMVIYELLTNATKYGCFSDEGGKLDVTWKRTETGLQIDWIETCTKEVEPSENTGFGTRLFDMLPAINVTRDFKPKGLHLTITIEKGDAFA